MKNKYFVILTVLVMCFLIMASAVEYRRIHNLRVKGWLFGDTTWCGLETWATTGTVDTLVASGVDTTCYFFVTSVDSTSKAPLFGDIGRKNDTVFVKCDSSVTADELKYCWMIIRP